MNRHEGLLSQVYIKKPLLCVWWGIRGIVLFKVLKPGETVNADLYCEQFDRLNQSLIEKYQAIINRKGVILQQDNARSHCARKMLEKLMDWGGRNDSVCNPLTLCKDGATPHIRRQVKALLSANFGDNRDYPGIFPRA
ncbi:histone-lysine N-methyltransferase SETMAR [Trichonephila clavipes]|nr:histone-lysine N-methyltransferase SETMAR [Trichonephila clavipes]